MEYYISSTKKLCEELEQLHYCESDINISSNKAAKQIKKTLTNFRDKIRREGFDSTEDEVHFFKYVKPKIQAYLIFYSVLAEIESSKLHMGDAELLDLIEKKVRMFRHIMRENLEFVKYYNSGLTHLDKLYFIRDTEIDSISKNITNMLLDPEFNASHDFVASNIIAFDLFKKHLIPHPELKISVASVKSKLKWTATKLDLVELIYALQASGAINYGGADLKDICSALESIFCIQVGDLYRAFHDISNRKKERIKYVNRLESDLERKILELEGM